MNINKYNLFINNSFDKYKFDNLKNNSIFQVVSDNMTFNTVYLVLNTKPTNNSDYLTVAINSTIECYLFPTTNTNVSMGVGELLQTHDNNAIFIITNYIIDNKFGLKLVQCNNGINYNLNNNIPSLIYNEKMEQTQFEANSNKNKVMQQWSNYTEILNKNDSLGNFLNSHITFTTDYTSSYNLIFNFTDISTEYTLISNIIDKFYLNIWFYDYNDFKYIYNRDLSVGIDKENYTLTQNDNVMGIIKSSNTKIIPHVSFKLQKGSNYNVSSTNINNYTSYKKSYSGQKILVLMQLSLNNKNIIYDLNNNIESDSIFIIF